jgi:hypothetical protein
MSATRLRFREIELPGRDPADEQAFAMAEHGGALYIGTRNHARGASLLRLEPGGRPERILSLDPANIDIYGLVTYRDRLYFGTYNLGGGELFRLDADGRPERIFDRGLDDPDNRDIWSFAVHGGRLYLGTWNSATGCKLYLSEDGEAFTRIHDAADPGKSYLRSFAELRGQLYASLGNRCLPLELWRVTGRRVEAQPVPAAPPRGDGYVLRQFRDALYLGVAAYHANEAVGGCEVWRFDGAGFAPSATGGFGNPDNIYILSMAQWRDELVCATYNFRQGCELWASPDGIAWRCLADRGLGLGPANESVIYGLADLQGTLYAATRNPSQGMRLYALDLAKDGRA